MEVGNNIKFSEMKLVTKKSELSDMIKEVLQQGLEGKSQLWVTIFDTHVMSAHSAGGGP